MNKLAVIDSRMSAKCRISLEKLGLKLIETPENIFLDKPVSAHPDLQMFIYKNTVFAEKKIAEKLKEQMFLVGECDYNIFDVFEYCTDTRYPDDCTLNFAVCGKSLIGNRGNVDAQILKLAKLNGLTVIDVKQGYAKCNICVVNDNAIMTEDKGIAKACRNSGINVLLLETNSVRLNGYKYGFIGGASGLMKNDKNKNVVLFCGDIASHPEYKLIFDFISNNGAEIISLSDEPLYDYGSIFIL